MKQQQVHVIPVVNPFLRSWEKFRKFDVISYHFWQDNICTLNFPVFVDKVLYIYIYIYM